VPAVAEATERAYRHRAGVNMGWPLLRSLRRLRPDPLRRLHLPEKTEGPVPATSLPAPTAAQRASVGLAVRTLADNVGAGLPVPWQNAMVTAARSRLNDLPDALDRAVATTDLGLKRTPWWWRVFAGAQWLATVAVTFGLCWLLVGYAARIIGLPAIEYPRLGVAPLPTVLLVGGLLAGALLAGLAGPIAAAAARRARARAETRLRTGVAEVAEEYVVLPVGAVVEGYREARAAIGEARR